MNLKKHKFFSGFLFYGMFLFIFLFPFEATAGIVTDGTVGPAESLTGPDYTVPALLGTQNGGNLFHSFQSFSIQNGESATFTGPETIENVISRVTGGEVSNIDGVLRSTVGSADFYFINPSGVVFGPNADVDVPAAFHVTTADELKFADGTVFSASEPSKSSLGISSPESFGFLNQRAVEIVVNGSTLMFKPGSEFSFSGNNVEITDAAIGAEGGILKIIAQGENSDPAYVPIDGDTEINAQGTLLVNSSLFLIRGDGGGSVQLGAGEAVFDDCDIVVQNTGEIDSDVSIYGLFSELDLLNGSVWRAETEGTGYSGDVLIYSDNLNMDYSGIENIVSLGSEGNAGKILVDVKNAIVLENGSQIADYSLGSGDADSVDVRAEGVRIDGGTEGMPTGIASGTYYLGDAGDVSVKVQGDLELVNGGYVISNTLAGGDAGDVYVSSNNISMDGNGNGSTFTGISTAAGLESSGNSGSLTIESDGTIEMYRGAQILNAAYSEGDAGLIKITADSMKIDDKGEAGLFTGISSSAYAESKGAAGDIGIYIKGPLEIYDGAVISSNTLSESTAGIVEISSGSLIIDNKGRDGQLTGITSSAESGSIGGGGSINLSIEDNLELYGGGQIISSTYSEGDAGHISVNAGSVRVENNASGLFTLISSSAEAGSLGNAGSVSLNVIGDLEIYNGGQIITVSSGEGDAGKISITANNVIMDDMGVDEQLTVISSSALHGSKGNAGSVTVDVVNSMELYNGAEISSDTFSEGTAGNVEITAKKLTIDDKGNSEQFTGISSGSYTGSNKDAGSVTVNVQEMLELSDGAQISSSTYTSGNAGTVKIVAGDVRIFGGDNIQVTGISSSAYPSSQGNAGSVIIEADNDIELLDGAQIASSTFSSGDAGLIYISADNIIIRGDANGLLSRISSSAEIGSSGDASSVVLDVRESLQLLNIADIFSYTQSSGNGGSITINAGSILLEGEESGSVGITTSAFPGSAGNGGSITLNVKGLLELKNNSQILSSTFSSGKAGDIEINAENLNLDGGSGDGIALVSSSAETESTGNAGTVVLNVDHLLSFNNWSEVSSSTYSSGNAGTINIYAETISMDSNLSEYAPGIFSIAQADSAGLVGDVEIRTDNLNMSKYGVITIAHLGTLSEAVLSNFQPGHILIKANKITMDKNSQISAFSSGNAPASAIEIDVAGTIVLSDVSFVSTEADTNDGGTVIISSGEALILKNSLITTSTQGGNGGDISLSPTVLVMDTGFIQANTLEGAKGGDIFIDSDAIIGSSGNLEVGGLDRRAFEADSSINVIQAAAPGGEQGYIKILSPELDLSAVLVTTGIDFIRPLRLSEDPCLTKGEAMQGSLVSAGRGKIPSETYGPNTVSFYMKRLKKIFNAD